MMKTPLHFIGMYGIGDCLHQRAVLKELLVDYDVWLETCHVWCHLDMIEQHGLNLVLRNTNLWGHRQNISRETRQYPQTYKHKSSMPRNTHRIIRNWYHKHEIDKYGSILETMMGVCGLPGVTPDFRLPMRPEWLDEAHKFLTSLPGYDKQKPLMIYRPIVHRREWPESQRRNPNPRDYAALYKEARKGFFVVSLAYLNDKEETIFGPTEYDVDFMSHNGALSMAGMAALYHLADAVFCNAGNAPVIAQAVGTPSITVYGGRESFTTTQRAGAHLAPSLGIDPDPPCDCHGVARFCPGTCVKRIDVPNAITRIRCFLEENAR